MSKRKSGRATAEELEGTIRDAAVIMADSFSFEFRPITFETARSLLPLVNAPVLEYTIEFLVSSNIPEIFVFCCAHAAKVEQFIKSSKWADRVTVIKSTNCMNIGDALREIHRRDIIRTDFILVSGDVISNMDVKAVLEEHRARRIADPRSLLTMVFKKGAPASHDRYMEEDLTVALNPETQELLKYSVDCDDLLLDDAILLKAGTVDIRSDLFDCNIMACSPDLLENFSENFDWADLKTTFLNVALSEDDIYDFRVFSHILPSNAYAARVNSLRSYDSVSSDIIHRWTYPLVPDSNIVGGTRFAFEPPSMYVEPTVKLDIQAQIGHDCVFGGETVIGAHSSIDESVFGRKCTVGSNCTINHSYFMPNVTVEDGAVIDHAFICEGAIIRKNAKLLPGSVVSFGVIVGEGHVVGQCVRLTKSLMRDDDDDEFEDDENDNKANGDAQLESVVEHVGQGGCGHKWQPSLSERVIRRISFGVPLLSGRDAEEDSDDDDESSEEEDSDSASDSDEDSDEDSDSASDSDEESSDDDTQKKKSKKPMAPSKANVLDSAFVEEALKSVRRAIEENLNVDDIETELSALKFSTAAPWEECAIAVLSAVLVTLLDVKSPPTKLVPSVLKSVLAQIQSFSKIIAKYLRGAAEEKFLLFQLMALCRQRKSKPYGTVLMQLFVHVMKQLYDLEILSSEACIEWAESVQAKADLAEEAGVEPAADDIPDAEFVSKTQAFIDWLQESSDEEDSEDD